MTGAVSWPEEYAALVARLPAAVDRSRLVVGGFSTCVDVYLSLHDVFEPLCAGAGHHPESASLLAELKRRALTGVGGELFVDWPEGGGWIDRHVSGRKAIGGTNAQASYMLAQLGARSLIALADRSADQLEVLHPDTLVAAKGGIAPVSSLASEIGGSQPHYIFEFTAGGTIDGETVPRSSRTIVRFEHNPLHRDPAFVRLCTKLADDIGAGLLCGFNEVPPETAKDEFDYAAGVGAAWRRAGIPLIHVEFADFPSPDLREAMIDRVLPTATSLAMSLSELADLAGDVTSPASTAVRLANAYGLDRICIHADEWAFAATRGDAERELEALMTGCLVASARAEAGYFSVPVRAPEKARYHQPPLPPISQLDGWNIACCAVPYLDKPAATIGLGDTFLAGTLLVLGRSSSPARESEPSDRRQRSAASS